MPILFFLFGPVSCPPPPMYVLVSGECKSSASGQLVGGMSPGEQHIIIKCTSISSQLYNSEIYLIKFVRTLQQQRMGCNTKHQHGPHTYMERSRRSRRVGRVKVEIARHCADAGCCISGSFDRKLQK